MNLIERLASAPQTKNPALVMSRRLAALHRAGRLRSLKDLEALLPEIAKAASLGEWELAAGRAASSELKTAPGAPARRIPMGF